MVKSKTEMIAPNRRRGVLTVTKPKSRPPTASNCTSGNIKVVVRVRPFNEAEQQAGDANREIIKIIDEQLLIFDPKEKEKPFFYHGVQQKNRDLLKKNNKDMQFVFDRVFHPTLSNEEVFQSSTYNLIDSLMDGFNCSVFAYGATGAGKTFTMIGSTESPGITYLTMQELFKRKEELSAQRDFELGITYLEVYNENVQDLLNPGSSLHLREDSKYGVMVAGIKMHRIENPYDLFSLLEAGNKNRTQHPTDANAESSRSHAVFQVYLHMTMKISQQVRTAKLSMIDLAGSERASATGCVGARFAEGANINKSLLALGNCINSLADGHRHIPYRDSKLTRLLKDSLGGNCQTIMIANVSPASLCYEDTYNTLKYATRAKKIKSNIKRNIVNVEMHVGQYVKIVEELKEENRILKKRLAEFEKEKEETVKNTDLECVLRKDLILLLNDKKLIIERQHQIESLDLGMAIRKQFKEEADTRVSGHCIDTPEKTEAHKKIGNVVERFENKGSVLKDELVVLQKKRLDLECKINELVTANPELLTILDTENKKLSEIEIKNRSELTKKKMEIMEDELQSQHTLVKKMSNLIKPLYLTLKGHGFATDSLTKDYQSLSKELEGIRSIKWSESLDSGLSSTTSLSTDIEFPAVYSEANSAISLNDTFTLKNRPTIKLSQEDFTKKVYKSPAMKKYGIKVDHLKENKLYRRPLPALMGSKRVVSAKLDVKKLANKTNANRPPFKR